MEAGLARLMRQPGKQDEFLLFMRKFYPNLIDIVVTASC
jgi:hypothetical protein